jgi:hypothetical protein
MPSFTLLQKRPNLGYAGSHEIKAGKITSRDGEIQPFFSK